MPRKFKRVIRKRYWKSTSDLALKISIPLAILPVPDSSNMISSLSTRVEEKPPSCIVSIPLTYFEQLTTIQQLKNRVTCNIFTLPEGWVLTPRSNHCQSLTLYYFQNESSIPNLSVTITEALEWTVLVQGYEVVSPPSFDELHKITSSTLFIDLLQRLSMCSFCIGNGDHEFIKYCTYRKGVLHDKSGIKQAYFLH